LVTKPEVIMINYRNLVRYNKVKTVGVNQVGFGSSCIGGTKAMQLSCREKFVEGEGCNFSELGVQPPQWNLKITTSCQAFFALADLPENKQKIWIAKPSTAFHGAGIKIYEGTQALHARYYCGNVKKAIIVQEYLAKPALMGGHKFDFRTYLLIASMQPFIAFYHEGFVRRSEHAYDTDASSLSDTKKHITNAHGQSMVNHFFSFSQLQDILTSESGFSPDYMNKTFEPHAMRVTNFIFQAAKKQRFKHTNGRYQLFALDWMLDADGGAHLLEANGNPQISPYPKSVGLTPTIWTSMMEIVHRVQVEPHTLPEDFSARARTTIGRWKLVYNEQEETSQNSEYNPCKFRQYAEEEHPLYSYVKK